METLRRFAQDGAEMYLVDMREDRLSALKADLEVRGAKRVIIHAQDLSDLSHHQSLVDTAIEALGGLDAVFMAHGVLGDQQSAQTSVEESLRLIQINFISYVSLLTLIANYMEGQRRGIIAVISSVAGDRGRGSNYIYGSAMAGKTAFLSGLRNRLAKKGVQVLTIKPGMVDTPMTAHLPKNALFADPAEVGAGIYAAMKGGKDVVYLPFYWRYIMLVIRSLPEFIFKRLSL
jgi:short-subunit dehydrogenase